MCLDFVPPLVIEKSDVDEMIEKLKKHYFLGGLETRFAPEREK